VYGVVVCSRCKRAKGIRIGQKTSLCQCGNVIKLTAAKVKSRTNDARQLARSVGMENARLRGGREEYEKAAHPPRKVKGAHGRVAEAAENAGNRDAKVRTVAVELSRELGTFSARDFAVVLISLGIPSPQKRLEELVETRFIYQPSPDRFKAV